MMRKPMPRIAGMFITTLTCLGAAGVGQAAEAADPPHVNNGGEPRDGLQTLQMEELWRIGGDEEDLLLGAISQVLSDEAGNIYILDRQTSEVHVISPDGEYQRSLSREGEGPGETRRPRGILFLPDGNLGIVQSQPGKIVKIGLDGTPVGDIVPGGSASGGMSVLFDAQARAGQLVVCHERISPGAGNFRRDRVLARIDEEGEFVTRLLENSQERSLSDFKWVEEQDYFVHMGGLALGPEGRIYAAPVRDRYVVHVYNAQGELERVIEREFEPRRRSSEDKEEISAGMRMVINGREIEKEIGEFDPCIGSLWVDEHRNLWVASSRSNREQPEGILMTYDQFDTDGVFIRQLAVACAGDGRSDRLFPLGGGRAILVRGMLGALRGMIAAPGTEAPEEEQPLEVICYRMVL